MRAGAARWALLLFALALVSVSAYRPHWDPSYPTPYDYPVHMDEYVHWGYAREIQRTGVAEIGSPFGGRVEVELAAGLPSQIHERGYQSYLAILQEASGIPWVPLLRLLPLATTLLLALAVFVFAERWGAGVEAALWIAAIPTTLRFLGPGFVVPVVFAFPVMVIGWHALVHGRGRGSLVVVGLVAAALWPIHAFVALVFAAGVLLYLFARAWDSPRVVVATGVVLAPFLLAWPYYERYFASSFLVEPGLPASLSSIRLFGVVPFLAAALGVAWLLTRGTSRERSAGLMFGMLLALALAVLAARNMLGTDLLKLYDRTATTIFLLASIPAGFGLHALAQGVARALPRARSARAAGWVAIGVVLLVQLPAVGTALVATSEEEFYYRLLDEATFSAWEEARTSLGPHHQLALVDGPATMAWTDITGIPTFWVQFPAAPDPPGEITRFFQEGSSDTAFLAVHGITVVVTWRPVDNEDLHPVAPGVYALDDRLARRLAPTG